MERKENSFYSIFMKWFWRTESPGGTFQTLSCLITLSPTSLSQPLHKDIYFLILNLLFQVSPLFWDMERELSSICGTISWIAKPGCIVQTILLEQTPWKRNHLVKESFIVILPNWVLNSMHRFILHVFFFQQSLKFLRRKRVFPVV